MRNFVLGRGPNRQIVDGAVASDVAALFESGI